MGARVASTATITLPKPLAAALALFCAEHREQPAAVVADALALHLDELGQHYDLRPQDFNSPEYPPGEAWPRPVPGGNPPGEATRAPPASTPRRRRTCRAAEEMVPALRALGPASAPSAPPPPDQLELLPAARS